MTTHAVPGRFRRRAYGRSRRALAEFLAPADVQLDGDRPWDIQVHDDRMTRRILSDGNLGVGESYMEGWWDSPHLDAMLYRVVRADLDEAIKPVSFWLAVMWAKVTNLQTPTRSFHVGRRHYDVGDDLYRRMLDSRMMYSCGYWERAEDLEQAQLDKLTLIFRKLGLEPGMRVLDIGCGWGGAALEAARTWGVEVVGVTISENQHRHALELNRGLPVEILLSDYRDLPHRYAGAFDRIYSIGMFEHVGFKNYETYMQVARTCLKPDGLFLLHTIGNNRPVTATDPWIARYIFPNSLIPAASQITRAYEPWFVAEDWHGFGPDYDRTLMAWLDNVEAAWDDLPGYDERFRRMWRFYLSASAAAFRARKIQLWQIVLSPSGLPGGYERPSLGSSSS